MKRKPKEETRWCIEYPIGRLRLETTEPTSERAINRFEREEKYNWNILEQLGYKCVKIKIRRA